MPAQGREFAFWPGRSDADSHTGNKWDQLAWQNEGHPWFGRTVIQSPWGDLYLGPHIDGTGNQTSINPNKFSTVGPSNNQNFIDPQAKQGMFSLLGQRLQTPRTTHNRVPQIRITPTTSGGKLLPY